MFGNSKGKLAVFSKRTTLLLAPIPCLTVIISVSSGATFENIFSVLLSDDDRPRIPAVGVAKALTTRPLPYGISDYGTVYSYNPDDDNIFGEGSDMMKATISMK